MSEEMGRVSPGAVDERLLQDDELEPLLIDDVDSVVRGSLRRTEHYDLSHGIAARVLAVARRMPDALAVDDGQRCLTYRQLASEFLVLARRLQDEGVRSGGVVAIALKRSAGVIIGVLAAQYLGAIYLPLPDDWPVERTRKVLADCRASVVLVGQSPPASEVQIDSGPVSEHGGPRTPAYIIYTSGSTGVPKGAVVERRGMMNHLECKVQDLGLCSSDVVAQTAPLAFDISIWQMLSPLLVGAKVQILDEVTSTTPSSLLDAVAQKKITVLELVPTMLRQLLDDCRRTGTSSSLAGLRWMLATGEVLPPAVARLWRECQRNIPLLNAYGPTECSDDVTHHVVTPQDENSVSIPIGRVIANTALYVLEWNGVTWRACRPGETGELFVGGVGVGRGYLGDPEKTRQAFFRDTLTGHGRLYRTGDLVLQRPDGVLEYRGRRDRQAKIRGIRIELEEIEATLREHPAVMACAVLISQARGQRLVARDMLQQREESTDRKVLVAYVVLREPVPAHDLRAFLSARIPEKVIPERYIVLSALPLTSNGKTDYAALPHADAARREVSASYEPPATDLERVITSLWAECLQIDRVGRHDKFLELGGDSLAAMQVVSQLRLATGRMLGFTELLIAQTPARLAAEIEQRSTDHARVASTHGTERRDAASSSQARWPVSAYQEGIYFQWRLAPESPYYTYQGALRLLGPVDPERLNHAWNTVVAENPQLRGRFVEESGRPWLEPDVWQCPLGEPRDMRDLPSQDREKAFRAWAHEEAQFPFDLSARPALRAMLFRFASDEYRILLTLHEILMDGWAAMVLFSRLAEVYGTPGTSAPRERGDFKDYLGWEATHLQAARISGAARYWSSELSGSLPALRLPTDRPRPRIPSYRGALVQHVLSERELQALDVACLRAGATRFMVLLAAFGMVLCYYDNSEEVSIGVPISNRDSPEQANVVAFLLNMLPMRLVPHLNRTCSSYLEEIRDKVLRTFTVADYPFSWMLRELNQLSRAVNQTPIFQAMLNVLNYPSQQLSASGVTFEFVELDSGFTKYDCSLYAQPHGANSLLLQLAYQTDLFDESTASRMLESVTYALCALGEQPDTQIGRVNLLPAEDMDVVARS